MADIQINVGKKDITNFDAEVEFPTYGEVEEFDSTDITFDGYENDIETEPSCIEIEITGLKTIERFIGLADTPLYYDNGKFFKVQDNKIVYADLTWEDISGKIDDNPQLKEYLSSIVETADEEYVQEAILEAIELHRADYEAHPNLREIIDSSFTYLDNKIELNQLDTEVKVNELDNKIQQNKNDIELLKNFDANIDEVLNDFRLELDVDIKNEISKVQKDIQELDLEVQADYTKLDTKIDSTKEQINNSIEDLYNVVDENYSDLNSRVNVNTGDIKSLSQSLDNNISNITTNINNLTSKVNKNTKNINTNTSLISNNTKLINQTIENLKQYSKTKDFSTVAFTGLYTDLINVPNNLATTEFVTNEVVNSLKDVTGFEFIVVDELPEVGETKYIYLLWNDNTADYDEYCWLANEGRFELIGTTDVDLSNFYKKDEINSLLDLKVDKQEGKSLISDTEIERLANVDNYNDTEIRQLILNLDDIKQNKLIAGENVELTPNVDDTVTLNINATEVLTDDKTIVKDLNNIITAVGLKTKTDDLLYDWIGTLEEYELGISNGDITSNMRCMVTDDEESILEEIPTATIATLGIVKPDGTTISVDDNGTISANIPDVDTSNLANIDLSNITDLGLQNVLSTLANVAKTGSYNDLNDKPTIITSYNDLTDKPTIPNEYTLPTASTDTLGGVKVDGSTISITDGIISAIAQSSPSDWEYSLGTNSYLRHKTSGLMIQSGSSSWSTGSTGASKTKTLSFPKAFNTKCLYLHLVYGIGNSSHWSASSVSKTNFSFTYNDGTLNSSMNGWTATTYTCVWLAFGY